MSLFFTVLTLMFPTVAEQRYASLASATPSPRTVETSSESAVQTAPERLNGKRRHSRTHRGHHKGCQTYKCDRRVDRRYRHNRHKRWRRVIAPYRGWLMSTGNCETRGYSYWASYRVNTGNGFSGRYQFKPSTWWSVGGKGYAFQARPIEQDYRAVLLRKRDGTGPWPICG